MKIAIVGGGMAGLSAALELSSAGHQVQVLEKYSQLGGLASTVEIAGAALERFYHHIFSTDLDILDLIEQLGLWEKLRWYQDDKGNWFKGNIFPFSTPLEILKFSPLSLKSRLRLAAASFYLSRIKDYSRFETCTAREWLIQHMGEDVYHVLWEPLLKAKFGAYAEFISMAWFYGRVRARFGPSKKGAPTGKLGYLDGSVEVLVRALEERLKAQSVGLRTGQEVRRLVAENGRLTGLETRKQFEPYDAVLVTCATPLFLEMAGSLLPQEMVRSLGDFKYYASCIAILELKESLSPHYWLNILDPSIPFLAVIEQTKMLPPSVYQGETILYLAKYLDAQDPFYQLPPDQVLANYLEHLKKIFPQFKESSVLHSHVMRAEYTQPIVMPGYEKKIPGHRLPVKGLYLCNMTQIYPEDRGMSYSIGLGKKVAKMMVEDFQTSAR